MVCALLIFLDCDRLQRSLYKAQRHEMVIKAPTER
jgi:hypothetical protein